MKAYDALYNKLSKNPAEWQYNRICRHNYEHVPFSKVPVLNYFFHRHSPGRGNQRTVNYAQAQLMDFDPNNGKWFETKIGSNLRIVMDMGGEGRYSLDTGNSGNVCSPYYFNMNENHL